MLFWQEHNLNNISKANKMRRFIRKAPTIWLLFILTTVSTAYSSDEATKALSIEEVVLIAIKNNHSIQEAIANEQAAQEDIKSQRADLLPQLSAGYGYTALKEEPIRKMSSGPMVMSHQYQYTWDVTVIQPLFAGFALHSKLKIAQLERTAKELEKMQVTLDIIQATRTACHQLLLGHKLLMVSDHEVTSLKAHKRDAELFYREGLISPNDQLKAEVALANSLQNREKARSQVQKTEFALNQLLGRPLDELIKIEDNVEVKSKMFDVDALSKEAIEARPIMQLLAIARDKIDYSEKMAKSSWYPNVSLAASYQNSGKDPGAQENDFSNPDESYLAVNARWNFFSSGKTVAQTKVARKQFKALESQTAHYRSLVLGQVRSAVLECQVALKNIQTAEKALTQARENYRITNLQYQEQTATSTDVLDANNYLTQADTNYYRAVYDYLDASAALDRAIAKKP